MKVNFSERAKCDPTCELRIGISSWDGGVIAMKFTWFGVNGQAARGGEFPIAALPQMLDMAIRYGFVSL